jgi:hypothetical protein
VTTSNGLSTIAVQYFVADRFWIKGGVGVGTTRISAEAFEVISDSGLGFMGASGFELIQKHSFALDLQARFWATRHRGGQLSQFSVGVGFNWY